VSLILSSWILLNQFNLTPLIMEIQLRLNKPIQEILLYLRRVVFHYGLEVVLG